VQQESTTTFMTVYGNWILESTPVAKQIDRIGQYIEKEICRIFNGWKSNRVQLIKIKWLTKNIN
jgi:hypothetical protein